MEDLADEAAADLRGSSRDLHRGQEELVAAVLVRGAGAHRLGCHVAEHHVEGAAEALARLLARVADRRVAQEPAAGSNGLYWSNPVSNRAAMMRVFNRWARILMERLDTAQRVEAERPGPATPAGGDAG